MINFITLQRSVAEPKLFICGSDFVHNFGSGLATALYCEIKLFYHSRTIIIEVEISFSSS